MLFRELNRGKCKTYLVACERTRRAALIDPVKGQAERYLALLAYERLTLDALIDTHTHADHPTGSFLLKDLTDARLIMHRRAPVPAVTEHVDDGDTIQVGDLELKVLYTPGHTPDSISLYTGDRVFTGDVLLIGGTGRADFAGGDSGDQFDAITGKLFSLPDETLVFPAHDYRGNTSSTIGQEKNQNPRVAGRSREEY
ncbi:MAG TPA: MBL fold metallo-hydrolase, partial [Burkholderiales bacterium]|nr:MBL fold metallo-hydrolase [Burkholderiales bacterium]